MNSNWIRIPVILMAVAFMLSVASVSCWAEGFAEAGAQAVQGQQIDMSNSFNTRTVDPIRSIQISQAPPVEMRGGPAYFGGPPIDMGAQFIPTNHLAAILNAASERAVNIDEDTLDDIEISMQVLKKYEADATDDIVFEVVSTTTNFSLHDPLAVISVNAEGKLVNSCSLAVELARRAKAIGGKKIIFLREGVKKRLTSSGWGVGFSNNISVVNASPTGIGGLAASGTGYSAGEAEYISLPYLTAVICAN
jgi:hypothetical protein